MTVDGKRTFSSYLRGPWASIDIRYDHRNPRRAHVASRPFKRTLLYVASVIVASVFIFLSAVNGS